MALRIDILTLFPEMFPDPTGDQRPGTATFVINLAYGFLSAIVGGDEPTPAA